MSMEFNFVGCESWNSYMDPEPEFSFKDCRCKDYVTEFMIVSDVFFVIQFWLYMQGSYKYNSCIW